MNESMGMPNLGDIEKKEEVSEGLDSGLEDKNKEEVIEKSFEKIRELFDSLVAETPNKIKSLSPLSIEVHGNSEGKAFMQKTKGWLGIYDTKDTEDVVKEYEKHDPNLFYLRKSLLGSEVRHDLGSLYSYISPDNVFLSTPSSEDNEETAHHSWYDLVGLSRHIQKMKDSRLHNYSEESREHFGKIKSSIDSEFVRLVESSEEFDYSAVVFGIVTSSLPQELQTRLWQRIKENKDRVSIGSLEDVVEFKDREDLAVEAWEILKERTDVPWDVYHRILGYGASPYVQREAAQILLAQIVVAEESAKRGDKDSVQKLNYFGYSSETKDMYPRFVDQIKEKAGE